MKKRSAALVLVIALIGILFTGCGVDEIDISEYKTAKVILSGLTESDEAISIAQLKQLECVTKKTHSTSDKIGEVRATGPLLETLLENYGTSVEAFSKIKIYGEDDYDIVLQQDYLKENDLILAFGIDGEPLTEDAAPIRVIIPESDSAYWIRMVEKIEFIK